MTITRTLLASVLTLAAGSASAASIGVTMTSFDNPFLTILLNGMKEQAAADGVTLQLEDAKLDVGRQLDQVQSFIATGVDAIIVNAVDGDSTVAITQQARDAGIPLIYANHPPADVDNLPALASFVGSNELDSGTLQTREVCRLLGGKGNVLVLIGPLENHAAHTRTHDIEQVIRTPECQGMKIVDKQVANWSRTEAYDRMTNWLTSGVQFDAVIANNDEMAIGAIQALKAGSVAMDKVVVAGIDATPDGLKAMKDGDLDITVFQNATAQGKESVKAAIAMSKQQPTERQIWVPFELVTPQNISHYTH